MPTIMSVEAMKIGLEKSQRIYPLLDSKLSSHATRVLRDELSKIWTLSPAKMVLSYEEAVTLINREKSPGFPYYYKYQTKGEVLDNDETLKQLVLSMCSGSKVESIFSLTEKGELRPNEKVLANKTRVFMSSPIHHLLCCLMLFNTQNQMLIDSLGFHPITIGIQIPGAQFVRFLRKCGNTTYDADGSGFDLTFHKDVAAEICQIRSSFLPSEYHDAVKWLYETVYCGFGVALGGLYRVFGNKSGWCNTSHDNSLCMWWYIIYACEKFYPGEKWDKVVTAWINGDDLILSYKGDFRSFCDYLKTQGIYLETDHFEPRPFDHCVFLSHHIETRWVRGFGDFLLAAGNLPKLKSSLNWVKTNKNLMFEESCVAHLIGLRMCLYPWADEFEHVDEILSQYLSQVVITPFIASCLSARFNELEMAYLHTRSETLTPSVSNFSVFCYFSDLSSLKQVVKGLVRLFKRELDD